MHSSVSSTLVTVWAFKRNCFLIKVSMSTSVRSFRIPWSETRNYLDTGVPFKLPPGCNFNSSKRLNAHYTFRRRTVNMLYAQVGRGIVARDSISKLDAVLAD